MLSTGHLLLCSFIPQLTHKAGVVLHVQVEAAGKKHSMVQSVHSLTTQAGVTTDGQCALRQTALSCIPSHSYPHTSSLHPSPHAPYPPPHLTPPSPVKGLVLPHLFILSEIEWGSS